MTVPVVINGENFELQLDSGADVTFLNGHQASDRKWTDPADPNHLRPRSLSAGGMENHGLRLFLPDEGKATGSRTGGTLGLDFFVGKITIIDYPGQRFCVMNPADFPASLSRRFRWVPATLRLGKLYVPVQTGGGQTLDLFFDTGSSAQAITVDFDAWQELTGLSSPDQATTRFTGNSFGFEKTWLGAASHTDLKIGPIAMGRPTVFFERDNPAFFSKFLPQTVGLFGNAGLWDKIVVVSLLTQPRFGILE